MTETTDAEGRVASTPSSICTFLVADLRGYTAFTHKQGDEAAGQLSERFLALCRDVTDQYGGEVFGSAGDQALAAFPSARQALRASIALQACLASEQSAHPELPLGAGIGLDAGEAVRVGTDYRGGAINLAARLCSMAGAGESFASEGVVHLAQKTEGLAFLDRGTVQLKGVVDPVRVIQIVAKGTEPEELAPLQTTLIAPPSNLPDEPTPFIGREREIDEIARLLGNPRTRLVTLTGPGGTGKTRLAVQVGNTLLHDFRDGAFFVSLASLTDPGLVPSAIAEMLGVREKAGEGLLASLAGSLRDKRLLLILDNFEHLLDAVSVVASLLDECRQLQVLATSRIRLHLVREYEYPVPPLAVPDPKHLPPTDLLSRYEAVALFVERAGAVRPGFGITNENAATLAEICTRLDGLPLAIELAAARIKLFPPRALLKRLENRLALLTGGAKDRPTRQQTLRNTIDWSYSLLTKEEQTILARLGVFAGGCTFEAAEAVCNSEGDLDLLEGLASLLDNSLLRQEGEVETRFGTLETIREYALEQLAVRGEAERLRAAHAMYFLQLAEEAEIALRSPEQGIWFRRLERELDNLRMAIGWLLDRGAVEEQLRLAAALFRYWYLRGYWSEGRRWLEDGLAAGGEHIGREVRAKALVALGNLALFQGDFERATSFLEESLRLFRELGDREGSGRALNSLGGVAQFQGEYERAIGYYEESLRVFQELGNTGRSATTLGNLGALALDQGDRATAKERLHDALALFRSLGDPKGITWMVTALGVVAVGEGNLDEAQVYLEEGLSLARELGAQEHIGWALYALGELARRQGEYERASGHLQEALSLADEMGNRDLSLNILDQAAALALAAGDPERAARLKGAEMALRERLAFPLSPVGRAAAEEMLAQIRAALSEEAFTRAWGQGGAMSLEEAMALVLEGAS